MSNPTYLLDSNILVFANTPSHKNHAVALSLIKSALTNNNQYAVAEQVLLEWFSSMTSTRIRKDPISNKQAIEGLKNYLNSSLIVIRPNIETSIFLQHILNNYPAVGKDVFDRYLAATALSNGISTILTENVNDFKNIPGITAINPFR